MPENLVVDLANRRIKQIDDSILKLIELEGRTALQIANLRNERRKCECDVVDHLLKKDEAGR